MHTFTRFELGEIGKESEKKMSSEMDQPQNVSLKNNLYIPLAFFK